MIGQATPDLLVGHEQVDALLRDRKTEPVAVAHGGQRTCRWRPPARHAGRWSRRPAGHARIRNAHHVPDAGLRKFLRDRQVPASGIPAACGPAFCSTRKSLACTSSAGSSMRRARSSRPSNTTAPALGFEQARRRRRALEDRAIGADCPAAPRGLDRRNRIVELAYDRAVHPVERFGKTVAEQFGPRRR